MKVANQAHKLLVLELLANAFDDNLSVNYIVKQDEERKTRVWALMDYSFEICLKYGQVYLSEDEKSCALVLFPELKKTSFWTIKKDIQLIFQAIGISGIPKALKREGLIKKAQWKGGQIYLWFIAVDPKDQGKGIGAALIQGILNKAGQEHKKVCLETSTIKNIPWYQKNGFEIYQEIDFGFPLYFLKN